MSAPQDRRRRLLASLYAKFGEAATYTPPGGGAAAGCVVRPSSEDAIIDYGSSAQQAVADKNLLKVRADEVAAPAVGGVFRLTETGAAFKVMGVPRKAHQALEWICEVREVAP